ncbi:hypothetical protein, partial [Chryseobacterium sp. CH1]|uniref:hypothetical protein n=1 Tax=Chryseobacterium sp. CH1 TaxID=713551 RepID=UPI001027C5E5
FLVRNTYFGKVIRDGYPFGGVQEFSPKVVTDISVETLSPKTKASLGLNYGSGKFNFLVRNTYFGKVIRDGYPFGGVQEFSPKVVTDIS